MHWVPIVAEVEWHAGHRGFERPAAVRVGGARLELTVESSSSVGGAAGLHWRRVFTACDSTGRHLRISVGEEGHTVVEEQLTG